MLALSDAFSSFTTTILLGKATPGFCTEYQQGIPLQCMQTMIPIWINCCIYATFDESPDSCCVFTLSIDLLVKLDKNSEPGTTDLTRRTNLPSQQSLGTTAIKPLYPIVYIAILSNMTGNIKAKKKCPPPVREKGSFWSDVSVFLRPMTLVRVAVLPRLVVIIPLTSTIATFIGQKNNRPAS